jgi:catechol 2,3-dioxygenase-like lactoylglutathione lyase family enzyme
MAPPRGMEFHIRQLGPILRQVSDLERSTALYTQVLGFRSLEEAIANPVPGQDTYLPR